ncbi:unnamed protein product [Dovyalis caffra]|uniref:ABC1 atypical kinase-like domain-containing protein n=1 Tax=Dovyalis caffra TaxID=77055 RepID=A0AAV1SPH8_9ROSI|nr:unnamed protein product [Dovyalis caffra]
MRNAFVYLKRHRQISLLSNGSTSISLRNFTSQGSQFQHPKWFSTAYSSVHGGRPSAEYAKLRKESLESEFGQALSSSSKKTSILYRFGPLLALYRATIISFHVLKLTAWELFVHDIKKRAVKFRETLIDLGPFYIKASAILVKFMLPCEVIMLNATGNAISLFSILSRLGQALSTRPDILPTVYCHELAKLQDQIPTFPTHVAIESIESQLGRPVKQIFADISPKPIAAASLGQVYKG